LTNASQAAAATGALVVVTTSLDVAERRVTIQVEDNGSGIQPEHAGEVFAPFFTTKGDHHGTGLGLSIVKSIIETHQGEHPRRVPARTRRVLSCWNLPAWQRG